MSLSIRKVAEKVLKNTKKLTKIWSKQTQRVLQHVYVIRKSLGKRGKSLNLDFLCPKSWRSINFLIYWDVIHPKAAFHVPSINTYKVVWPWRSITVNKGVMRKKEKANHHIPLSKWALPCYDIRRCTGWPNKFCKVFRVFFRPLRPI